MWTLSTIAAVLLAIASSSSRNFGALGLRGEDAGPEGLGSSSFSPVTAISCSFPDSSMAFSLYKTSVTHQNDEAMVGYNFGQNINADPHPQAGVLFTSDVNGSFGLHLHAPPGSPFTRKTYPSSSSHHPVEALNTLLWSSAASINDHARWTPDGSSLVMSSTQLAAGAKNVAWNALYWLKLAADGTVYETARLSPQPSPTQTSAEYSPAISPCGNWVAFARGSGKHGGTDIWIRNIHNPELESPVIRNGGWPTFGRSKNTTSTLSSASTVLEQHTIFFHRNTADKIWGPWEIKEVTFSINLESPDGGSSTTPNGVLLKVKEQTVVEGGMTPYVAHDAPDVLVYAFIDTNGYRQIALMNLSTAEARQITSEATHHFNPSYVGFSGHVFYQKMRSCGQSTAPNIRRFTSGSPDVLQDYAMSNGDFPSLSPDRRKISIIDNDFRSMSVMNSDGSDRKIIYNESHAWMTSWVSGNTIAATRGNGFQPANDGFVQVMTIESDGSNFKLITNDTDHNQGYPCYSPNGTMIVYRTNKGMHALDNDTSAGFPGPYHLVIMNADGTNKRNLTTPGQLSTKGEQWWIGDTHAHWGRDDLIVFVSDRGHAGRTSVWTIRADGSDMKEVFDHPPAMNVHPSMTPDNKHIAFTSTVAGYSAEEISWPFAFVPSAEVFTITIDGKDLTRVSHDFGENANVWVGHQSLPRDLSSDGLTTTCSYRDSTDPPGTKGRNLPKSTTLGDLSILSAASSGSSSSLLHLQDLESWKDEAILNGGAAFPPHGSVSLAEKMLAALRSGSGDKKSSSSSSGKCPYRRGE